MWKIRTAMLIGALCAICTSAWAAGKCDGSDIANGPFSYTTLSVTQATFSGTDGAPVATSFDVAAPTPGKQTSDPDVFPGEGATNECAQEASADLGVIEIEQVTDASGSPLATPVSIDLDSALGAALKGAFSVAPSLWAGFEPGESTKVEVSVSNPQVADYGGYSVKLAAKADGYGIGVGAGAMFSLVLRAATATDTTPPVPSVTKPTGDEILGQIGVEVNAYDPADGVATGLKTLTAVVSSAKGVVSNLPIALTLDQALPAAPGTVVTGIGKFIPTGGTGATGTNDASAFTSSARSGIGSYTITAIATDVAGNIGSFGKTFNVKYAVSFTKAFSTQQCQTGGNGACTGQFKFTVNRSGATSDGAFMFDHTVTVKLLDASNTVVATHSYGTGAIGSYVQIDAGNLIYQTNFNRGNIGAIEPKAYKAEVYFTDVDGTPTLQGTSGSVTF